MNTEESSNGLASQACLACRKQKRRCDKQLPSCTLCTRNTRQCQYIAPEQARDEQWSSSEELRVLEQRVNNLEAAVTNSSKPSTHIPSSASPASSFLASMLNSHASNDFPSLFFIDAWAFAYAGYQAPIPRVRVPVHSLDALGTSVELRSMIENYFTTVHTYLPIISKIRLYQVLSSLHHDPGGEYLLLFTAIKLVTTSNPGTGQYAAQTPLYRDTKALYTLVEAQNGFTIHTLQALLLIGLYELGNAIWPAAYLTTGACARLGHALGVHSRHTVPMLQRPITWTEQEERRRVAWAMIILDRYANVGHHHRPFACEDPSLNDILPTDDAQWDRGQMGMTAPLALSATVTATTSATAFARLCQAGHILSKVIRHTNNGDSMTPDYLSDEALQLEATVRALLDALRAETAVMSDEEICPFFGSLALCLSAAMTLYDNYSCSTSLTAQISELQLEVHKRAIGGLSEIVDMTYSLAQRIQHYISQYGLSKLSPLVIDCLYSTSTTYAWYVRESSDQVSSQRVLEMKEVLRMIDAKWKAAGESVRIVEVNEFHLDGIL